MRKISLLMTLICLLLSACNYQSNKKLDELDSNQQKWKRQGIVNYQVTTETLCFCIETGPIVVIVADSELKEAFYVDSGEYLNNDELTYVHTIEDYFDIIRDAINRAEHLTVEYDSTFGYPTLISIDYSEQVADDEIVYRLSNLQ